MATTARGIEDDVEVLTDARRAAELLDPGRRRLLEELRDEPASAAGLARRLGESRQRLNYHLRALEDAGLVELQEERRRGNCVERVLRVVARRFVVDPAVAGRLAADPGATGDRFASDYLVALAARTIREVAHLREKAAASGKRLATGALASRVVLAEPEDVPAFVDDLAEAVARVVERHGSPDGEGRPFRVWAGTHQEPPPDPGPRTERQTERPTEQGTEGEGTGDEDHRRPTGVQDGGDDA